MRLPLFLGLLLVAGCGEKTKATTEPATSAPEAPASVSTPPPSAAPSSSAKAASSAAAAPKALTAEEKAKLAQYLAALGEGRKATKERRYEDAKKAFGRALAARPDDARARAELGYAYLLAGEHDQAAKELEAALAGGVEPKVASQAFYNLGLAREVGKDEDGARAAFAAADALASSTAAKARLAGRSRCVAQVTLGGDPLEAAGSCLDVGNRMKTTFGAEDETRQCSSDPPWTFHGNYMQFTQDQVTVAPKVGGTGAWSHRARVGIWDAHCINLPDIAAHLAGDRAYLRISTSFNGTDATIDENRPMVIEGYAAGCMNVMGYQAETFYDLTTGKQLLHVYLPAGVPAPKVVESGGVVKLDGAGCDQAYDLKKLGAAPPPP